MGRIAWLDGRSRLAVGGSAAAAAATAAAADAAVGPFAVDFEARACFF